MQNVDPTKGIEFLSVLWQRDRATKDDVEMAIEIARTCRPIVAYREAKAYFIRCHGTNRSDGWLAFAKGTWSLSSLRCYRGRKAYEQAAEKLRREVLIKPAPSRINPWV